MTFPDSVDVLLAVFRRHVNLLSQCKIEVFVATTLFLLPAITVILVVDSHDFYIESVRQQSSYFKLLLAILTTNIPSALFLFAGIITLGIPSGIGCILLGMFLGFSVESAVGMLGAEQVIAQTWMYTPIEIYGFILAGASGLVTTRRIFFMDENPRNAYLNSRSNALSLLTNSIVILSVSAVIEAGIAVSTQ